MKPYGHGPLKGISGRRKSKKSAHRKRCLRIDKKRARNININEDIQQCVGTRV